ncbi:MAG: hypothetical protein WA728_18540 [Xanthobacteraceae bacterium]
MADPFSREELEDDSPPPAPAKKRIARSTTHFIKFPDVWVERMNKISNAIATAAAYRLALFLLKEFLLSGERTITLANERLETECNVRRWAKNGALHQLEQSGLVVVDWRNRKSPIVTLLHTE